MKIDPEQVARFGRQLAEAATETEREAVCSAFREYAAEFIDDFSYHYRDFVPQPDGNVTCLMDGYIRPRDRVAYVVDTRTGFIRPVDRDAQRGVRHQKIIQDEGESG